MNGVSPVFKTPLPEQKDFGYWSERFRQRQEQYNITAEVQHQHVEIQLPERSVVNFIGDIHVGAPDVDYKRIDQEISKIIETPNSYVMLMGDLVDGFFFNPAQMEQIEQAPEQYEYARSLIRILGNKQKILVGWGGDHDNWAKKMGMSAYRRFAEEAGGHYINGVGFITITVGDYTYKITGAHRLPGNSMYNKVHAAMRAEKFGAARGSDVVVHGHTHMKGYSCQSTQSFGGESQETHYISIGPYKYSDDYARKLGLTPLSGPDLYGSSVILHDDHKRVEYFNDILIANQEIVRRS